MFVISSFVAELLVWSGISLTVHGEEYAEDILGKILDVFAGSLILWGVIGKNPAKGGKK